jgi:BMFP domain-containing protein YqiC
MSNNKFFDDVSKIATSSMATLVNLKNEVSGMVKEQVKAILKSMDVVTRNEFNSVKKMLTDIKAELVEIKKGEKEMKKKTTKKTVAKKPAAKKPAAKKAKAKK